ncbi:TnpV protein [Hespellia stercorisuis]|uniref:Transposon-encoded protein TnpV n=1 Tax=Hespellia stercorisuis DSM 15480 TaxID=1121950 RepID=A0A1M6VRA2_9FIRM|nr:TnpV protein [Hespellia stercorisuis]SHK84087.1 Transposon-encoded protein TnpV [Hespellia stercorisuis DSM 15480]
MEKHIMGEKGLSYTLGEDGLYYPDLKLTEGTHYQIGRYGRMRKDFLKEHRNSVYMELLLGGKLNEYLHGIDEECYQRVELLIEQMKAGAGVTEDLKASDQMRWVGLMNNLKNAAEEIVLKEMVYL